VRIPGHIGRIPGSYLRDINISTTAFEFCRDDATRESYVAALFDYSNVPNIRVIPPWLIKLPLDGSSDTFEVSLRLFLHYS
jgi:hypothetical protein